MGSREILLSVPRTVMDVFSSLTEVIVYVACMGKKSHLRILRFFKQLDQHAAQNNLGEVYCVPFDVFLDE